MASYACEQFNYDLLLKNVGTYYFKNVNVIILSTKM